LEERRKMLQLQELWSLSIFMKKKIDVMLIHVDFINYEEKYVEFNLIA